MISKLVFTAVRILEAKDINSSFSMTSAERSRKAPSNIPNDTSTLQLYFTFINIYNTCRVKMTAKASEIELRHRPLKVLYPEVELRKKYQESRLQSVKSNNSVFIRLEPNDKYCKIEGNFFISIIAPVNY